MALLQEDLKRLLAYPASSQIGYIVVGTGHIGFLAVLGGRDGRHRPGKAVYVPDYSTSPNHMLFKGGLFLISGALILQVNTRKMHKMGGC